MTLYLFKRSTYDYYLNKIYWILIQKYGLKYNELSVSALSVVIISVYIDKRWKFMNKWSNLMQNDYFSLK